MGTKALKVTTDLSQFYRFRYSCDMATGWKELK